MTWRHPDLLWLLMVLGGLALLYRAVLRRAPARTVVFPPSPAPEAARRSGLRRHLPAGALGAAVGAVILAVAGPAVPWPVPSGIPVVLIIDVSRSMEEPDIPPSRIEAAKVAALDFLRGLPRSSRVALVSFGNYATLVVPLTADLDRVADGIRTMTTQLRTQLGTGLVEGVRAVSGEEGTRGPGSDPPFRAVAVLLSDGRASDGVPPLEAAQQARARGVRVYTVGVGTATDPQFLRSGYWGVLDEPTLRAIAAETGGEYFKASEAEELRRVYRDLARTVGWRRALVDVSALAAFLALGALLAAVALSAKVSPIS